MSERVSIKPLTMDKTNKNIIHHRTLSKLMKMNSHMLDKKPLHCDMKEILDTPIEFEDYMLMVYDIPKWRWN